MMRANRKLAPNAATAPYAGIHPRPQHGNERHFVKGADAVQVVHVRPGEHAGGQQANKNRE